MEQFIAVAIAHFLALLIPGVDFFLIVRTTMTSGWRNAAGASLGIATANGVFIIAAFSGLAFISNPSVLAVIQLAGGAFLVFIGLAFIRSNTRFEPEQDLSVARTTWLTNFGLGIASGLLNPKNALFYLSLAAALAGAPPVTLIAYGVWMFMIVLVWDIFVAIAFGSRRALTRLGPVVPWLTKIAGGFLTVVGVSMIGSIVL
ncbi:MAG: LysE family translocator [Yaniella sp.]|uniref:LysE family translocator n=1 Tax=Yaniella sp. TaxID=2773929 RepID=UPI0026471751|nr:LysE family translocator [Yaniella sp.]MDN6758271.1 LysE family translocator [Yaniella sp.]